jgi:hypothetical protein
MLKIGVNIVVDTMLADALYISSEMIGTTIPMRQGIAHTMNMATMVDVMTMMTMEIDLVGTGTNVVQTMMSKVGIMTIINFML